MIDRPRRAGFMRLGPVIAMAAPILFAMIFMGLYGWKSWAINRQANLACQRQAEERAALEALKPKQPSRRWQSPDRKYTLLYYKDDFHSSRKRVQLLETGSGRILSSFETDAALDCLWRNDGKMFALEEKVSGKLQETTVWFVGDGLVRKICLGPAIEKLVVYKWKRPWKHFVGMWSWEGDQLRVNWVGKPIIRQAGSPDKFASDARYDLLLAFDDAGTVSVVTAVSRKSPKEQAVAF